MNIEETYLDKIWSVVNDGLPDRELMLSGNDQDKVEKLLEEYHQAKLKLLGIANVVEPKGKLVCDTCKSGLINYPEIHRRTCRCGALGYNVTD